MPAGYRAARRRRLRPRPALPALRRRRARAAAGADRRRGRVGDRGLLRARCGTAASSSRTPCARSTNARPRWPPTSTVRTSLLEHRPSDRRAPLDAAVPPGVRGGARSALVLRREGARAAAAPSQVPRRRVQPRAQRQGKPRRPARPADRAVDRARGRTRQQLARARAARADDAGRGARCRAPRTTSSAVCASGCTISPTGARTGWSSTSRPRSPASSASTDTPTRRASEQLMQRYYRAAKLVRQVNVILLQNIHARLYPAATAPVPIDAEFQRVDELLDMRDDDAVREAARRDARRVPRAAAAPGSHRHDRADAARAVARAAPDRRRVPPRSRRTARASSRCSASRAGSRTSCGG